MKLRSSRRLYSGLVIVCSVAGPVLWSLAQRRRSERSVRPDRPVGSVPRFWFLRGALVCRSVVIVVELFPPSLLPGRIEVHRRDFREARQFVDVFDLIAELQAAVFQPP